MPLHQRGVVLIFTLIILVIMMIGAVALMRSMNTSLFSAGNMAFHRDLVNQGEQAVATVMTEFQTGGALATSTVSTASVPALNYSAAMLPSNADGVPNALLSNAAFAAVGIPANDITGATSDITIRYVIDRLCSASGPVNGAQCVESSAAPTGGTGTDSAALSPPSATVYRVSVRVTGARGTQAFLQSTFAKAD
jgi:Tfp pilus assembly protein PilX